MVAANLWRSTRRWALVAMTLTALSSSVQAAPWATFDDGTLQGWTKALPFGGSLQLDTVGGNPGGFMVSLDTVPHGGGLNAQAPAAFTGDLSGYTGVAWDEFVYPHGSHTIAASAVVLRGGPNDTTYVFNQALSLVGQWHTRLAPFTSPDWQQLDVLGTSGNDLLPAVLQSVTGFYVGMDASNIATGNREVGIDNVRLTPEPSSLALLVIGLAGIVVWRRRYAGAAAAKLVRNHRMQGTLVLGLAIVLSAVNLECAAAPVQWQSSDGGNDHWYDLVQPGPVFWTMANQQADQLSFQGLPGHLVTIGSAAEQDFLVSSFSIGYPGAWIGLTDAAQEGSFQWVTGEPLSYTAWNTGEPNNLKNAEHYVHLFLTGQSTYAWNDLFDSGLNGLPVSQFLVEFQAVPEPSSLALLVIGVAALLAGRWRR